MWSCITGRDALSCSKASHHSVGGRIIQQTPTNGRGLCQAGLPAQHHWGTPHLNTPGHPDFARSENWYLKQHFRKYLVWKNKYERVQIAGKLGLYCSYQRGYLILTSSMKCKIRDSWKLLIEDNGLGFFCNILLVWKGIFTSSPLPTLKMWVNLPVKIHWVPAAHFLHHQVYSFILKIHIENETLFVYNFCYPVAYMLSFETFR